MIQRAGLFVLLALCLGATGDRQREDEIKQYYEQYYRELYGGGRVTPKPNYVPPTVNPEDDCEKLHNLIFQTRLGEKEIEKDDTFDQIVKILVFKKCDPHTFTKPTNNNGQTPPKRGQTTPNYGPNQPDYAQNQPNYGQNQPNYGQNQPNYGQNQPTYGQAQPSFGQNQPNYGQYQPNQHGQSNGQQVPNNGQYNPSYAQTQQQGRPNGGQNVPNRKPLDTDYDYYENDPRYDQNPKRQNGPKKPQNGPNNRRPGNGQQPDIYYAPDGTLVANNPQNQPGITNLYNRESHNYSVSRKVNGKPVFEHHGENVQETGDPRYKQPWTTTQRPNKNNGNTNTGWWK